MTSTDELESHQIHAQDCELEYWFQQAENYAEVQIPADDLRAIIARTYAAVNALPELLAENEKLREALRLFMGAATPVSTEIDPRGYVWSLGYLDQARTALKETGQ